jgi:hypothetical protein
VDEPDFLRYRLDIDLGDSWQKPYPGKSCSASFGSEPMKNLAPRFQISDVALRKTCLRAGIPTPERGHWALKEAGKKTFQPPLPERAPGMGEMVRIANGGKHRYAYYGIEGYPSISFSSARYAALIRAACDWNRQSNPMIVVHAFDQTQHSRCATWMSLNEAY